MRAEAVIRLPKPICTAWLGKSFSRAIAFACVMLCLGNAKPLYAQAVPTPITLSTPASREFGRIRGTVFDSLLMSPVARASVTLIGTNESVTADDKGNFSFDNVAAGAQTIVYSSTLFDSLGLGTLGATVTVLANETAHAVIATPSLHTMWTYRCQLNHRVGNDSGIVWGTIRDAATDATVGGGVAAFSWYDLKPGVLSFTRTRRDAVSDERGLFFACGLPTEISVATSAYSSDVSNGIFRPGTSRAGDDSAVATGMNHAIPTAGASGEVEYDLGARRLRRLDLLVSADMVIPDSIALLTSADSVAANRVSGRATVRGIVRDDKGRALANSIVMITASDTSVRTNSDGRFQLGNLPGGTHMIQVRRVGSAPATQMVELRPERIAEAVVIVSSTNALATVNVRAKSAQRLAFEERRAQNFGFAIDSTILNNRADLFSALSNHAGMQVAQNGSSVLISVRGLFTGYCVPEVFLDGLPSNMKFVTALPPDYFRTVEVLIGKPVPDPYFSGQCGVVLFWSKNIKW